MRIAASVEHDRVTVMTPPTVPSASAPGPPTVAPSADRSLLDASDEFLSQFADPLDQPDAYRIAGVGPPRVDA